MTVEAIQPLTCIVCEQPVKTPDEWVAPGPEGPIYGLHTPECSERIGKDLTLEWNDHGWPIIRTKITPKPLRDPDVYTALRALEGELRDGTVVLTRYDEHGNGERLEREPIVLANLLATNGIVERRVR